MCLYTYIRTYMLQNTYYMNLHYNQNVRELYIYTTLTRPRDPLLLKRRVF